MSRATKNTKTKEPKKVSKKVEKKKVDKKVDKKVEKKVEKKKVEKKVEAEEKVEGETVVRKKFDRDAYLELIEEMIASNEKLISEVRSDDKKTISVRHLNAMNKGLKKLKTQGDKLIKKKRVMNGSYTSGFLKPVNLSEELHTFTGWNKDLMKSRVDVTKFICDYIKENNLQNPKDRREILADKKLSKLLSYDSKKDGVLTYYKIQSYLKKHFV